VEVAATTTSLDILSGGELGALSDIAVTATDNPITITNDGTITGYVTLGAGADSFTNTSSNSWNLRNFADTDGNTVRDTEGVAVADFGGGDDTFTNTGTLRLATVTGALDWDDTTNVLVHPGNSALVIGTEGIEQGQLLNLETFINGAGGIIALTETGLDPVAGDLLKISGEFQSDGGELWLDVVLDDGAVPMADILLLETVTMPNGNPTLVSIVNAGGEGGETTGNGILIIDAETNDTGSGAFVLADDVVVSGAYQYTYTLDYDPAGLSWYLQSTREEFAGTAEYPALTTGALSSFYADLAPLHGRLRALADEGDRIEPASWNGSYKGLGPWLHMTAARQTVETQSSFDQTLAKLEIGIDGELQGLRRGHMTVGAFAGFGTADQKFQSSTSEAQTDTVIAGAYAGYRDGRSYGQAIVKYEHQSSNLVNSATSAGGAPYEVDVLGLSLEAGRRLVISTGYYLTPRARLSYAFAKAGSFEDASGNRIDLSNSDSLQAELAMRLETSAWSSGVASLEAGIRHEFLGEQEAEVSGLTFTHDLPGTMGFLATALEVEIIEDSLTLIVRGEFAKGSDGEEFTGSLGLNLTL
jgi:outer membrane autotransporter protein